MEINYLKKYFESAVANLSKHLKNPDFPISEKEKLKIRIELINEFEKNSDLQIKYSTEKQVLRIQNLSELIKTGAQPSAIKKQKLLIKFYDLITTNIPYVDAISVDSTESIWDLCNSYRYEIDNSGATYTGNFPTDEEVEKAFKPYFESVALSKYNMFKECYEKTEYLYKELKAISKSF